MEGPRSPPSCPPVAVGKYWGLLRRTGTLQTNRISLKLNKRPDQDVFINIASIYSWRAREGASEAQERWRVSELGNCWQMLGWAFGPQDGVFLTAECYKLLLLLLLLLLRCMKMKQQLFCCNTFQENLRRRTLTWRPRASARALSTWSR